MSGKLDQSLDQIMKDTGKPTTGRGRRPRPARNAKSKAKAAIRAPTGGIQKNKADTKAPAATALTNKATGDSKIIVSNLPEDVTETQIKDYFGKTIGHVKKVFLTYGPQGRSRGIAQIIFSGPNSGPEAAKKLDGVKVDNRAMRIEVVLTAKEAPTPAAPKGLADRMSKPKNAAKEKPKSKDKPKTNSAATTNGTAKSTNPRNKKSGRAGRPKKKTAEELDAEMVDYFGVGDAGAANGTTQQAATAGGDTGMVDEVL